MLAMDLRITQYQYDLRLMSTSTKTLMSLYNKNTNVAFALFLDQDTIDMTARLNQNDGKIYLNFKKDDLSSGLDLLRNENPVYLHYVRDGVATLSTPAEPVGVGDE